MHKLICLTDKNTISQIITTCGNNAKTVRDYTETSNCSVKSFEYCVCFERYRNADIYHCLDACRPVMLHCSLLYLTEIMCAAYLAF